MVLIRLDDKRIDLSVAGRQLRLSRDRKAGSTVLEPALCISAAPVDWECPTIGGDRAVSTEAPMLATLEAAIEGVATDPVDRLRAPLAHIGHEDRTNVVADDDSFSRSHAGIQRRESDWFVADMESTNGAYISGERVLGDRAPNPGTAVRFRGARVIFRSEPGIVDADRATDLLVIQDC